MIDDCNIFKSLEKNAIHAGIVADKFVLWLHAYLVEEITLT